MTELRLAPAGAKHTDAWFKVKKVRAALNQLVAEQVALGQHDRAKLIRISMEALDDTSLAKLHDMIAEHDTPQQALEAIDAR